MMAISGCYVLIAKVSKVEQRVKKACMQVLGLSICLRSLQHHAKSLRQQPKPPRR